MTENSKKRGFTLVEMLVIAPIVILSIGAFIALIVNLTGEVLSSRGSNILTYNVQDALNRIEEDTKLSTSFLAVNNINFTAANPQGYTPNSTTNFSSVGNANGPMLILNALVTNGNPMSLTSSAVYLANSPNDCSNPAIYSKNRPMTMNIVYFTDANGTLWRRTIMPIGYDVTTNRCGSAIPWQRPSCAAGYFSAFCKTNDTKLTDGVGSTGLVLQYFNAASATVPITDATNANDTTRATALQSATTLNVSLTSSKVVAGRNISRTGSLKVTRLDTNATSIANYVPPTANPAAPVVSGVVVNGNDVTFTWPRVSTATSYDLQYRINSGAWQTGLTDTDNNNRSYTVLNSNHTDVVEAQVRAKNSFSADPNNWASTAVTIPQWAPIPLEGGWSDYGTPWAAPSYTKTKSGVVLLRGLIRNGTGQIGKLPADYAPDANLIFATSSNEAFGRLDVLNNGSLMPTISSSTWFSLDEISYMPTGNTFTPLTSFANGWKAYNSSQWASPGYLTDPSGRISLRGVVSSGTTTNSTPILSIPAAAQPSANYTHFLQANSDTYGGISYDPSVSSIVAKDGGNSYLSINALYYPSSRATGSTCTTQWCALSMANGWVAYGPSYTQPQYTKGSDNIVQLRGLIKSGTAALMTTIPAGYCPSMRTTSSVFDNAGWGRVDIIRQANGSCTVEGSTYSNGWLSLDAIRYLAE